MKSLHDWKKTKSQSPKDPVWKCTKCGATSNHKRRPSMVQKIRVPGGFGDEARFVNCDELQVLQVHSS